MATQYNITIKSPRSGGGYDTKTFCPSDYQILYDSLASANSGRTANGLMRLDWKLRKITKLTIKLPPHKPNDVEYSTLLSLIQGQVIKVTYYDYMAHQVVNEEDMYCSKTNAGYTYMGLVEDVGFELIAMNGSNDINHINLTEYTVTWKNYDNTVLATETVLGGSTPSYPGATPTKPATAQYTYTFSGWSPSVGPVYSNTTYTAQFTSTAVQYTITTTSGANGSVSGGGSYSYGATVTLTATPDIGYVFSQWNDGNTDNPRTITVTGNASYSCSFEVGTTPTWTIILDNYISNSHEHEPDEDEEEDPDPIPDYDVRGDGVGFTFTSNGNTYVGLHADSAPEDFLYYDNSGGGSTSVYSYDGSPQPWVNDNFKTIVTTTDPAGIFTGDWASWLLANAISITPSNQ